MGKYRFARNTPFWDRLDTSTDCWTWKGYRKSGGYGYMKFAGKPTHAHRVAWILTFGEIPESLIVCHRCDNPPCCNPAHLFLGTDYDNVSDCISKGRFALPYKGPELVLKIRDAYKHGMRQKDIATNFSVDNSWVSRVVRRLVWIHI